MFSRRDYSQFIMDIYRTIGIIIPGMPVCKKKEAAGEYIKFIGSIKDRENTINQLEAGDPIYMKEHVVMYLGKIDRIMIGGGGSFNLTLLEMIKKYCNKLLTNRHIDILTQEELCYSSEAKEAIAFAVLAYQTMKGITNNIPQITKAKKQVVLGDITPGRNYYNYLKW